MTMRDSALRTQSSDLLKRIVAVSRRSHFFHLSSRVLEASGSLILINREATQSAYADLLRGPPAAGPPPCP
jgi:hypothetical protein